MSALGQSLCSSVGISPKIFRNADGKYVSAYLDRTYVIQEYIAPDKTGLASLKIEKLPMALAKLHQELEKHETAFHLFDKTNGRSQKQILQSIDKNISELSQVPANLALFDELLRLRKKLCQKYGIHYFPEAIAMIHGDIKPENVILHNCRIYFIDFDYICKGDLLYEVGRAGMLFSGYDIKSCQRFIKEYFAILGKDSIYGYRYVMENLLAYYVQSSFPIKLASTISKDALNTIIMERKKALEFCQEAINGY